MKYEPFSVYLVTCDNGLFRTSIDTETAFETRLGNFVGHVYLLHLNLENLFLKARSGINGYAYLRYVSRKNYHSGIRMTNVKTQMLKLKLT